MQNCTTWVQWIILAGEGSKETESGIHCFVCVLVVVNMTWRAKADGKYDLDLTFSLCLVLSVFSSTHH